MNETVLAAKLVQQGRVIARTEFSRSSSLVAAARACGRRPQAIAGDDQPKRFCRVHRSTRPLVEANPLSQPF